MKCSIRRGAVALSVILASATMAVAVPAAQADVSPVRITPAQCKEAHKAIAAGKPLPDPSLLRLVGRPSSMQGDTLHVHVSEEAEARFGKEIRAAAQSWTDASGGKIKVQFHDKESDGVVEISVDPVSKGVLGYAGGQDTPRPYIGLKPSIGAESRVYVIAHELGHQMGLAHGCVGDIMKPGYVRGSVALHPTATDVAAVMQGKPAFS